jgi:DNA-binding transcriptional MocR family regulator
MERALRRDLGAFATWREPRGGFFIWAALPEWMSAERLLERATAHRVIYVVGSAFFVNGEGAHMLRLSFSQPTPERLEEGVRRLAAAVREEIEDRDQGVGVGGGASKGTAAPIA